MTPQGKKRGAATRHAKACLSSTKKTRIKKNIGESLRDVDPSPAMLVPCVFYVKPGKTPTAKQTLEAIPLWPQYELGDPYKQRSTAMWIKLNPQTAWFQEYVPNLPTKLEDDKTDNPSFKAFMGTDGHPRLNRCKASCGALAESMTPMFKDAIDRARAKIGVCKEPDDSDDDEDARSKRLPARFQSTLEIVVAGFHLTVLNTKRPIALQVDAATHKFIEGYFPRAVAALSMNKTTTVAGEQDPSQQSTSPVFSMATLDTPNIREKVIWSPELHS